MWLNHIIIMTRSWVQRSKVIFWPCWNGNMFFWNLYWWIIVTWSCSCSTFLWVDWWSQTKLILSPFDYFWWDIIILWSWMLDWFCLFIFIISADRPKLFWMFFCRINITRIMCAWTWNVCYNFWIHKFCLYSIND